MKIECLKENILENISIAEKISGKNLTHPILNCILLTAKGKTLTIRSTNLDLGIEITIPVKVLEEGVIAVSGSVLYNTILTLKDSKVEFETIKNNLCIKTNTNKTLIKINQHDDFPTIPIIKDGNKFTLNKDVLLQGIGSVWYSASYSAIKPELSSVYLYSKDGKIIFVSTDSFRLSEKTIAINSNIDFDPILIPVKNIQEILKVIENSDDKFEIVVGDNQISFLFKNIYLTSRIIDGTFPDYKQIIPKDKTTEIILLKQDFTHSLKQINIFSDRFNQVGFHIDVSKKEFKLHSENSDVGETTINLLGTISGDDLDINFNLKYIIDCFQSISSDSISLTFNGLNKPVVIRGVSDNSFLYLVMPMNK